MTCRIKHIVIYFLFLFVGIFHGYEILAQQPHFKNISLPVAFSDCRINRIAQDSDGLMWLATSCGLMFYDGFEFVRVNDFDEPVVQVQKGAVDQLVVVTQSGKIGLLSGKTGTFSLLTVYDGAGKMVDATQTPDGAIWFAIYNEGIYRYKNNNAEIINSKNSHLSDDYYYQMLSDTTGQIWLATDNGINLINYENGDFRIDHLEPKDGLPDIMIVSLSSDESGNVFAGGYEGGFCKIESKSQQVNFSTKNLLWLYGAVKGTAQSGRDFWMATETNGLIRLNIEDFHQQQFTRFGSVEAMRFQQMMTDSEGNIWAVAANGIVMIQASGFEMMKVDHNNSGGGLHALMFDNEGWLWYATKSGLFRQSVHPDRRHTKSEILLPENIHPKNITCLHQDDAGRIWIGTFGSGLLLLGADFKIEEIFTRHNGFLNDNVLSISSDAAEVWFATLGGAARTVIGQNADAVVFDVFADREGPGSNFIYSVIKDSHGSVWFATDGTGIVRLQHGSFTTFGLESGLTSEKIYTMAEDQNQNIWCATHDNKVFFYSNGQFVEAKTGLAGQFSISSLQPDGEGNMLIIHENGISGYNLADSTAFHYEMNYGIAPIPSEFNSTAKSPDGIIWIAADDHLIARKPPAGAKIKYPVPVVTAVQTLFQNIHPLEKKTYSHDENYLTFNFSGLWYQNPGGVLFRVRLLGNDLDWKYTSDRKITYSRLSPGDYTFVVESALSSDFGKAGQTRYNFSILRPFWQTWWFIGAMALSLIFLTYTIVKIRLQRIRQMETLEKEKLLFQFETLRSQVNPHFLFNSFSTLISIIEDDKKAAQDYVEQLSAFFRNMLEYRDQNLITIEVELKIARNYIQLQQKRFGNNLIIEMAVDREVLQAWIPPLTLQLLLENAIKHNIISNARPLTIRIFTNAGFLIVENKIQKKNFTGDSTGFGLKTIRQRYAFISKEKVKIQETGGLFSVALPLIFKTQTKTK